MAHLPHCTHRYALIVSYIGSRYKGSQRLTKRNSVLGSEDTIQEALESSLESVLPKDKCRCTGGSRTDKGVHSLMSCFTLPLIDFSTPTERVKRLANSSLVRAQHDIIMSLQYKNIRINEVLLMPAEFHPRKNCVSREYIFRIGVPKNCRRMSQLPLKWRFLELFGEFPAHELYRLQPLPCFDMEKAEKVCRMLNGTHDFASFSSNLSDNDDTVKNISIDIKPTNDLTFEREHSSAYDIYQFRFYSRAFLYNQIRRMMGVIISYACFRNIELDQIQHMLDQPSPNNWPNNLYIAAPWGLYLSRMNYDKSSFENALFTFEDKSMDHQVPVDSIACAIEMSDDLKRQQIKKDLAVDDT